MHGCAFIGIYPPATADRLMALIVKDMPSAATGTNATKSGDHDVGVAAEDNEEDEGEILSDEEEMQVGGVSQQDNKAGVK